VQGEGSGAKLTGLVEPQKTTMERERTTRALRLDTKTTDADPAVGEDQVIRGEATTRADELLGRRTEQRATAQLAIGH